MKNTIKEIILALVAFEVVGTVKIQRHLMGRYYITLDGVYFGVWDEARKTFVD